MWTNAFQIKWLTPFNDLDVAVHAPTSHTASSWRASPGIDAAPNLPVISALTAYPMDWCVGCFWLWWMIWLLIDADVASAAVEDDDTAKLLTMKLQSQLRCLIQKLQHLDVIKHLYDVRNVSELRQRRETRHLPSLHCFFRYINNKQRLLT